HVVEYSKDQYGSRFNQQKLEHASTKEKQTLFIEVLTNARIQITDVGDNHVVLKFFECETLEQKSVHCRSVKANVMNSALKMNECRVI
ncbi:hypothetical protein Angca_008059, partial [Angiostrongylus cantonensis]